MLLPVFLVVSVLLSLAISTLFLWLGARLVRAENVSLPRLFGATIAIGLFNAILAGVQLATDTISLPPLATAGVSLVFIASSLVVPWLWLRWVLRTGFRKAAIAWGIVLIGSLAVNLPLAMLISHTVCRAFVVPTGAMAMTIFGQHTNLSCKQCGCSFAVSTSFLLHGAPTDWIPDTIEIECPNCGEPVATSIDAIVKSNRSGDWLVVNRLATPRRWDVMTFRYPEDPSTYYVMRLVGLPGETIEIADGDLFINGARLPKPPTQVRDLWLPVHDTRFPAAENSRRTWQPEQPNSGWRRQGPLWTFRPDQDESGTLVFSAPVTDALGYNFEFGPPPFRGSPRPTVRDVKVTCHIAQADPNANIRFRRDHGSWRMQAEVSARGEVVLTAGPVAEEAAASDPPVDSSAPPKRAKLCRPIQRGTLIAFSVRDGHVYVLEDGSSVGSLAFGAQDVANSRTEAATVDGPAHGAGMADSSGGEDRIAITVSGGAVQFARIELHRDVYYLTPAQMRMEFNTPLPSDDHHPCVLGKGEYYVLGDNSQQSKDSRFWGTVPHDAILGSVEYIYWPLDRTRRLP